jgi:hypothetical protein
MDRMEAGCNFPDALRLVQSGCQVRRAGWEQSLLYIRRNADLDRVELVRDGRDGEGPYCYAELWLGSAAIGGPPIADILAVDWTVVEDRRVPTEEGGRAGTGRGARGDRRGRRRSRTGARGRRVRHGAVRANRQRTRDGRIRDARSLPAR